jgi:lipid-binding SYLF domain-containing protein
MLKRRQFATSVALGCLALAGCAGAGQDSSATEQGLVDQATNTLGTMKSSGGAKAATLLQKARAILVFPDLVKGGIVVGGTRGQGVLVARTATGWSDPAFYESTSVSVGAQIGFEESAVVMFINTQKALDGILQSSSFTLKAGGSLQVADFNSGLAEQLTGADVVVWSKSSGAFAGIAVSGTDLSQRTDYDQAYYKQPVNAQAIIAGQAKNAKAAGLIATLGT